MTDFVATVGGRFEIEAIREIGDQVLVIVTTRGVGAASGAGASMRNGQVFSFRDGQISALDGCYSIDDALKALRLEK